MDARKIVLGTVAAALLAVGGGAYAASGSSGGNGPSGPKTTSSSHENEGGARGPGVPEAKRAALRATGGGHANTVERDSEDGATWEVEVRKTDGKTVDVRLDDHYRTVAIEPDSEGN